MAVCSLQTGEHMSAAMPASAVGPLPLPIPGPYWTGKLSLIAADSGDKLSLVASAELPYGVPAVAALPEADPFTGERAGRYRAGLSLCTPPLLLVKKRASTPGVLCILCIACASGRSPEGTPCMQAILHSTRLA